LLGSQSSNSSESNLSSFSESGASSSSSSSDYGGLDIEAIKRMKNRYRFSGFNLTIPEDPLAPSTFPLLQTLDETGPAYIKFPPHPDYKKGQPYIWRSTAISRSIIGKIK
jgi:hypothetical protein